MCVHVYEYTYFCVCVYINRLPSRSQTCLYIYIYICSMWLRGWETKKERVCVCVHVYEYILGIYEVEEKIMGLIDVNSLAKCSISGIGHVAIRDS